MHRSFTKNIQLLRFTLVELMVVIAIIAILTTLLLPALNKSKDFARKASCMNNMKTMGLGVMNYCDDNNGFMPRKAGRWSWAFAIAQTLQMNKRGLDSWTSEPSDDCSPKCAPTGPAFLCPAQGNTAGLSDEVVPGKVINSAIYVPLVSEPATSLNTMGGQTGGGADRVADLSIDGTNAAKALPHKRIEKVISGSVIMIESIYYATAYAVDTYMLNSPPSLPATGWAFNNRKEGGASFLRHCNSTNVLFIDGHVQNLGGNTQLDTYLRPQN